MNLKTAVDRFSLMELRMNNEVFAFGNASRESQSATHPLARLRKRLPLSLLLAGTGLQRRRFAAFAHPDTPSGASNHSFQVPRWLC